MKNNSIARTEGKRVVVLIRIQSILSQGLASALQPGINKSRAAPRGGLRWDPRGTPQQFQTQQVDKIGLGSSQGVQPGLAGDGAEENVDVSSGRLQPSSLASWTCSFDAELLIWEMLLADSSQPAPMVACWLCSGSHIAKWCTL